MFPSFEVGARYVSGYTDMNFQGFTLVRRTAQTGWFLDDWGMTHRRLIRPAEDDLGEYASIGVGGLFADNS